MKALTAPLVVAILLGATGVYAQQPQGADHSAHHGAQSAGPAAALASEGEVRRVDLAQGKVTLRHGPLTNLDMPAMTMVFTATDKALLDGLKQGDKVRFTADKQNGTYIVTAIEIVN